MRYRTSRASRAILPPLPVLREKRADQATARERAGVRVFVAVLVALVAGVARAEDKKPADAKPQAAWKSLFDGKSLAGWTTTEFGAHGKPSVENGTIIVPAGEPLSGITREKDDVPHVNYEVELEAQKVEGNDFFLALTFPVNDTHASLVLGGWSGGVCGISSIDGFDASENPTTSYRKFDHGKWYKVRLRVTKNHLAAWLDAEQIVDADITDKKIGVRIEVSPSKPFGLATYMTKAAYRNIRIRELTPDEIKSAKPAEGSDKGVDPSKIKEKASARV